MSDEDKAKFRAVARTLYQELGKPANIVRGQILSEVAAIEAVFPSLIQAFLMDGVATQKLTAGFNAPLGTFSAQIAIARSLGLISEGEYKDLNLLRQIRNDFAHSVEASSAAQSYADRCKNFKSVSISDAESLIWTEVFTQVALTLFVRLKLRIPDIAVAQLVELVFEDSDMQS